MQSSANFNFENAELSSPILFFVFYLLSLAGQVDRSVLEEFVPYALMHAGYLDMSRQGSVSA